MKTAIVFGVTGQDGSYLAELLLGKGYTVVGVTRRSSTDNTERIEKISKHCTKFIVIEGDVTDAFSVSDIINKYKPDEVYNLAAQSHVGTSFKQPTLTWDVTAGGCLNILEAIRLSERRHEIKFYQASSSEMFGKSYSVVQVNKGDGYKKAKYQNEDTPFVPQSPYAIAKLAAHHLVRNYRDSYGIFGCCGILFNHESERRGETFVTRKITKWIGDFLRWEKNSAREVPDAPRFTVSEETISIPIERMYIDQKATPSFPKLRLGNLEARRDWGHAADYVKAMWQMVQKDDPDDYVIATGETHSVREFLDHAFKYVGIYDWECFVYIDPEFFRPAEVDFLLGDTTKAREKLQWTPEITFKALVEKMMHGDLDEGLLRPDLQTVQD